MSLAKCGAFLFQIGGTHTHVCQTGFFGRRGHCVVWRPFITEDELAEIQVGSYVSVVDDADGPFVRAYKWRPSKRICAGRETVYAITDIKNKTVRMHRLIMDAKAGEQVDHRNHNGLDNRRENLRFCSNQQNQFNTRTRAGRQSNLKGVTFHYGKWQARCQIGGEKAQLGSFDSSEEARAAYVEFAKEQHGEFFCSV